jgi:hypothetical protein
MSPCVARDGDTALAESFATGHVTCVGCKLSPGYLLRNLVREVTEHVEPTPEVSAEDAPNLLMVRAGLLDIAAEGHTACKACQTTARQAIEAIDGLAELLARSERLRSAEP